MSILLAGPNGGTSTPPPPTNGTFHTLTGVDGSVWELTNPEAAVRLKRGVRGLGLPTTQRDSSRSPIVPGSRTRGIQVFDRDVFWPVGVWQGGTPQQWLDLDAAWWRAWSFDQTCRWTVTQPNGSFRYLDLLLRDDSDFTAKADPSLIGWVMYGMNLVAPQPYWRGPDVTRSFEGLTPQDFYSGTPYYISASNNPGSATLDNPGDIASWPTWTITAGVGGLDSWQVGLDGHLVGSDVPLLEGQSVTIVTDPAAPVVGQTAVRENGDDVTGLIDPLDYAPVPPGTALPLSLLLDGAGMIDVALPALYRRAW
jgi:hypothetical protein